MRQMQLLLLGLQGVKHIPCFAHTLDITVNGDLEVDSKLTALKNKYKDIVTFFHHT